MKSNFATPTLFGRVSCFVVWVCLFDYNLNSFLIHQASYPKRNHWYLMQKEVLGSIWKIGRYPIKVTEVLSQPPSKEGIRGSSNKEWDFLHSIKTCVCIKLKFTIRIVWHLSNSEIETIYLWLISCHSNGMFCGRPWRRMATFILFFAYPPSFKVFYFRTLISLNLLISIILLNNVSVT